MTRRALLLLPAPLLLLPLIRAIDPPGEPRPLPAPPREFRGAWVATVANIDWPSKRGLPVERQKAELIAILDRAVRLKLNAIVFQVRPAADALYASRFEPWSEFLTGRMGQAPEPFYDPLTMAVEEAHKRGLELHAWFNPFRARHPEGRSPLSPDHIARKKPQIVKRYGPYLWLDPGEPATQEHTLNVIMDVVSRYDVDGVHIDDYFYPYHEKDSSGHDLDFPDGPSWQRYRAGGGTLSRGDWRRDNVNRFIERMYRTVKAKKPWVKVGISPFGIWRPGNPPQITGFDAYDELYADSRLWLRNGWLDYIAPQLYWRIAQTGQSYPVLLRWWTEQNPYGRHIWAGNYTSRVADGSRTAWRADEVVAQIEATRRQPGATGNIHFSMVTLMNDKGGIDGALTKGPYVNQALVPSCPWIDRTLPGKPRLHVSRDAASGALKLAWQPSGKETVRVWVVQYRYGPGWATETLPGPTTTREMSGPAAASDRVAVSAVDRNGNQGPPAIVEVR